MFDGLDSDGKFWIILWTKVFCAGITLLAMYKGFSYIAIITALGLVFSPIKINFTGKQQNEISKK